MVKMTTFQVFIVFFFLETLARFHFHIHDLIPHSYVFFGWIPSKIFLKLFVGFPKPAIFYWIPESKESYPRGLKWKFRKLFTPEKYHFEPKNHPIGKEKKPSKPPLLGSKCYFFRAA